MSVSFPARSMMDDCERVRASARRAGFPGFLIPIVVAISKAETEGSCSARSTCRDCVPGVREFSVGPFQLNLRAHGSWLTEECARDFDCSARAAFRISGGRNFAPWTAFRSGAYKRFLEPIETALPSLLPPIPTLIREEVGALTPTQAGPWQKSLVWVAVVILAIFAFASIRGKRGVSA